MKIKFKVLHPILVILQILNKTSSKEAITKVWFQMVKVLNKAFLWIKLGRDHLGRSMQPYLSDYTRNQKLNNSSNNRLRKLRF